MQNIQIFAHRGSKGTHPENTMAAFQEAAEIGAEGIEFDVHLSSDGELVIIHDETLDRTTSLIRLCKRSFSTKTENGRCREQIFQGIPWGADSFFNRSFRLG